jgi:hypothetical protein
LASQWGQVIEGMLYLDLDVMPDVLGRRKARSAT